MRTLCGIILAAAALPLAAADGDFMASSPSACAFSLNTLDEMPFVVASQEDLASLMSIGWSKGESAVATAPDGTSTNLASVAASSGSATASSFVDEGGVWYLYNPAYGTVKLGVAWSVFGGGGTLAESATLPFIMDTYKAGPNRRGRVLGTWPGISFTGDRWAGDGSAASTVTVVDPDGNATVANFTGTGSMAFDPQTVGKWTITLANGLDTLVGEITASGGFSIIFK